MRDGKHGKLEENGGLTFASASANRKVQNGKVLLYGLVVYYEIQTSLFVIGDNIR